MIDKVNELNEQLEQKKNQYYNYHIQQDRNKDGEIVKQTLCICLHVDKLGYLSFPDIYDIDIQLE